MFPLVFSPIFNMQFTIHVFYYVKQFPNSSVILFKSLVVSVMANSSGRKWVSYSWHFILEYRQKYKVPNLMSWRGGCNRTYLYFHKKFTQNIRERFTLSCCITVVRGFGTPFWHTLNALFKCQIVKTTSLFIPISYLSHRLYRCSNDHHIDHRF